MNNDSLGKLILRLALGCLILLHGIAKLRGGIDPIEGMMAGAGLPSFIAYGVYVGEVIAPVLVILGWYSRIGAALIAVNMVFAIALVHSAELLSLSKTGGLALELQFVFLVAAIAIALFGPGRYSLNGR
jgi:putative oxidoreductase